MYDLIIIGGGPAGLTAAVYAIRKRLNVLLVSNDLGGKTNYNMTLPWMETYQVIRGTEIVDKFQRELEYLDFANRLEAVETVSKKDDIFTVKMAGGEELTAKTIILATGSNVKYLNVPGEQKYLGRGVSFSAISYAPLFIGKRTVVIGEGMLAVRAVAELAQVAESVHLVIPAGGEVDSSLIEKLGGESLNVVVMAGYQVKAIEGNGFAERVVLQSPEGKEAEIGVDGIFIELGLVPNTGLVKDLVDIDDEGWVLIDNANRTSCPGLFAAGDVTNAYAEQVLIAAGEGAKAALNTYEYLTFRKAMET
jgi:alkyl hydroperoxide reductase subunit F